ncbi:MAG: glycosyltransferase family 2 protein [Patescibacteria group bacterium]|nr:glycosyltransferase family 2 protein [Patescibacteria group bacterium]
MCDDGSSDDTAEICRSHGCYVVSHLINLGAGPATQTAIDYALMLGAEYVVTIDADGQHLPKDIHRFIDAWKQDSRLDVVLGSRFLEAKQSVPRIRRVFNKIASLITWILSGIWLSDSQSGFRGYTRSAAGQIKIESSGYEFATEVIREIAHYDLNYKEVPIDVIYHGEWRDRGQSFATGVSMVFRLFVRAIFK